MKRYFELTHDSGTITSEDILDALRRGCLGVSCDVHEFANSRDDLRRQLGAQPFDGYTTPDFEKLLDEMLRDAFPRSLTSAELSCFKGQPAGLAVLAAYRAAVRERDEAVNLPQKTEAK